MNLARLRSGVVTTIAVLAFTIFLSACGGESAPAPEETATPTTPASTREATPATPATPAVTPASTTPTPTGAVLTLAIDSDTRWQDLFDDFTASERACIRDALGEELEVALGRLVLTDEDTQASEVALFSCLSPETARNVFLSSMAGSFEESEGRPLSADEASCLRERVAGVDVAAYLAETASGTDAGTEEFSFGLVGCFPDWFLSAFLAEAGMTLDELSEEEASCLREWSADTEWQRFLRDDDATVLAWLLPSLAGCAPDLFLGFMLEASGITLEELGAEEVSCLRDWLAGLDWEDLLIDDESVAAAVASAGLARCLTSAAEPGSGGDRGAILGGAVPAPVGIAIESVLDGLGEPDVYVFQAEGGVLYRVDVTLGTLNDSTLALYDAGGRELAFNDDLHFDTSASRIEWQAPDTGAYYLAVDSFATADEGSYTLTIREVPNIDDHGDELDPVTATRAALGVAIEGALHYGDDVDVFVFEAEEGAYYQVDVTLGTLGDSLLALYDAGGWQLAFNDDHGDSLASRIFWRAAGAGDYYVAVGGYASGSYTLTITEVPNVDDHADDVDSRTATRATVGVAVEGVLHYEDDVDAFVFEAEEGAVYRVDVTLGTLGDSLLTLYDADGWELAFNDDDGDSLASRILWQAPAAGDYYIAVEGYGLGSYTLTITRFSERE